VENTLAENNYLSNTPPSPNNTRNSVNLSHHYLLSMPQTRDSRFAQSVVYILEHDSNGAWGVVINQLLDMRLHDVFSQLDIPTNNCDVTEENVHSGGPVDAQHGIVLHRPHVNFESTQHFSGGVSLSSSRDVLEALAAGEEPDEHLVLLGHAGWGPEQLESEITNNAWLTCEADPDIIFNKPVDQMRAAVGVLLGVDLNLVVSQSGRAWAYRYIVTLWHLMKMFFGDRFVCG